MTQFEAVIEYAGKRVKVKSDSFEELHATLAGIEELNRDADFLQREKRIEDVIPVYRKDGEENEYFGLQDRHSRKNVTYGKKRGESVIPFFPKGADGYYDPDASGPRSNGSPRSHGGERSAPQRSAREDQQPRPQQQRQRSRQQRSRPQQHADEASSSRTAEEDRPARDRRANERRSGDDPRPSGSVGNAPRGSEQRRRPAPSDDLPF